MNTHKIKQMLCLGLVFSACSFFIQVANASELAAIPSRPEGYVTDTAGIVSTVDRDKINSFARDLEARTTAQVAVVTVRSTRPEAIHAFSVRLFDKWKIGQEGKDNGVLILVAVDDREAWITTGYGIEGIIPDAVANRIVRELMIPLFRKGDYSRGILESSVAVISLIAREHGVEVTGQEQRIQETLPAENTGLEILFTILFFILLIGMRSGLFGFFLFGSMVGGRRRGGHWYGTGSRSYGGSFGGFGGFGGGMTGGGGGGGGW